MERLPAAIPAHGSPLTRGGSAPGTAAGLGALRWPRRSVPRAVVLPSLPLGPAAPGMVTAAWLRGWRQAASLWHA